MNFKKILYISYDGMTDPLGQSQVLPYLEGLSKAGHRVTLLSCEKPGRSTLVPTIKAICEKAGIDWRPIPYTAKPPVISTVRDIKNLSRLANALHKTNSYDAVHCRSYIPGLIGMAMKKRYGVSFVFDMRGFWADERVDGGLWNLSNVLYRRIYKYFKVKERQMLQTADAIVSLTHAAVPELDKLAAGRHAPVSVVPCCVDTQLFNPDLYPSARREVREKLGIASEAPVLGYVGSLGTWYLLDEMLKFFSIWKKANPEGVFLFISNEPQALIDEAAKRLGVPVDAIKFVRSNRAEVPVYISAIDIGIFFIKPVYSKMASSPVKQGELMAMKVPVICNSGVGDSDSIISGYNSGVLLSGFDTGSMTEAVKKASDIQWDKNGIRAGCIDYFDLAKGINAYKLVYESL